MRWRLRVKPVFSKRATLFRRMIMLSLAAAVLPAIAVGISSYFFSAATLQNEVNRANVQILQNASANIEHELQNIQDSTLQILFNPLFNTEVLQRIQDNDLDFNMQVSQFFTTFQTNHKRVLDISMYIKDNYLLSSSFGLFKALPIYDRNKLNEALGLPEVFQWKNTMFRIHSNDRTKGVTFISKLPLQTSNPIGLMLVRIDQKLFEETLQQSMVYSGQTIAVVNKEGETISSSSVNALPAQLLELLREKNEFEHKFYYTWNDSSYLVTSLTSAYTGWQYINLIPLKQLNAKSAGIGIITAIILAVVLLLAFVFTFLGTQWVYRPIANLMNHMKKESSGNETGGDEISYLEKRWLTLKDEKKQLQHQLTHQLPIIQESFVLQTLQGHFMHYTQREMALLFERYSLPKQGECGIFILTYDRSSPKEGKFLDQDRDLIIFAMKNIINDLIRTNEHTVMWITVNLLNDQIAVLLWNKLDMDMKQGASEWNVWLKAFVEEVRSVLTDYLRLPITAGLGKTTREIRELPQVYRQALSALSSRLVVGGEQVIDPDNGFMKSDENYRYPIELEQHYEASLKLGNLEESQRMLDEFSKYVMNVTHLTQVIHMSYAQLLGTTIRTIYHLDIDPDSLFKGEDPYEHIRMLQNMDDINHWFLLKLITPIVVFVQNKTFVEYEEIVENVSLFINENYHLDISQDECARNCGISRSHLSKLFKRFKQITFIDYLTQVRIEQAKLLLLETDIPVAGISEKVGYLHTQNFIRIFKKIEGMTPGQFRETKDIL